MKTTVRRAYEVSADGAAARVIAHSDGRVFKAGQGWIIPAGQVVTVAGDGYETWSDVPFGWLDGVPYWSNR